MNHDHRKKIGGGFGLALVVLVVIGPLSYWSMNRLIKNKRLGGATPTQVLLNWRRSCPWLKDAETGQRALPP